MTLGKVCVFDASKSTVSTLSASRRIGLEVLPPKVGDVEMKAVAEEGVRPEQGTGLRRLSFGTPYTFSSFQRITFSGISNRARGVVSMAAKSDAGAIPTSLPSSVGGLAPINTKG